MNKSFIKIAETEGIAPAADEKSRRGQKPPPVLLLPDSGDDFAFEELSSFCRDGVDERRLRPLRRGESAEESVDLHGMTVAQAHSELAAFLSEALAKGMRHVEVIHGKGAHTPGKPVLRVKARKWLAQCNAVLAFAEAKNNSGAVRVLLRQRR